MELFEITENDAHQRLDRFLMKLMPVATRGLIFKLNRTGKIKVSSDGIKFKEQDNEYKLVPGERVKLFITHEEYQKLSLKKSSQVLEKLFQVGLEKKDIVFEDASLLVINKNVGINVHPGDHKTKEVSLIEMAQDYLGNAGNSLTFKPSLCHRIDRDTSGLVLIAKDKNTLVNLTRDFREHKNIKKTYYCLVLGKLEKKSGTIDAKILRIENAKNENKVQISPKGDIAISHYKVLSEKKLKTKKGDVDVSEVLVDIETGRMHQIRIHMASIGHPIIGDKTYGDLSFNHYICQEFGFCRQALHAYRIDFMNYYLKRKMQLEARLKDDIAQFLKHLV